MRYKYNTVVKEIFRSMAVIMAVLCFSVDRLGAVDVAHYAPSSVLATGKWVKVKVEKTGMQRISDSDLRKMGFSTPENVRVYGYGGRQLSEGLGVFHPDDLPQIPCLRSGNSLIFFGVDHVDWKPVVSGDMKYSHVQNHYSEESWYFLSDREAAEAELPVVDKKTDPLVLSPVTTFTSRQVYELDAAAPSNTGRRLLGEDFRSTTSRTFNFDLPGNSGGDVRINTVMAADVKSGSMSFILSANGTRLPAGETDVIRYNPYSSADLFMALATSVKTAKDVGEKLALKIDVSTSGIVLMARLDYIEVEYSRNLELTGDQLHFYDTYRSGSVIRLKGCGQDAVIWDVTDPKKPMNVEFALSDGDAIFAPGVGYREFVAFVPSKISGGPTDYVSVGNQDIHSMPVPDMLIIAPSEYLSAAGRVASLHERVDGMIVHVLTPEVIYNEFSSGNRDVTALRKVLKMWYDRDPEKMKYCLIFGRPTYDNKMVTPSVKSAGYPRVPIWQSMTGMSEVSSYSTDDYIGMLEDCQPEKFLMRSAMIKVAVGRVPVKTVQEADEYVSKLEKYLESPAHGFWRNRVMIIADDQDYAQHLDQAQRAYTKMRESGNGTDFIYDRLYLDSYPMSFNGTGASYPEAKAKMMQRINDGVMFINYIGHASTRGWGHEGLLTWSDIQNLSNTNHPIIYAATCEFARWDSDDISAGELMLLDRQSGAICLITPSRSVYIYQNGIQNEAFSAALFERDLQGRARTIGEVMLSAKNSPVVKSDDNYLRYCMLGDPALRLPSPTYRVDVTEIGSTSLEADLHAMPEIKAREKVGLKGVVRRPDGSVADDFNGILELQLYDAEAVIETYGNGSDGVKRIYNDRTTKLVNTSAVVKNGEWTHSLLMPAEISNNYSPALLSGYAYDTSDGREANGSTERLYVYGSFLPDTEDTAGPDIEKFYINTESFENGAVVNASPLVYGSVSDESGINLSESGIGHRISLILDGDKVYDDVGMYYQADPTDVTRGEFTYPLSDIGPGKHTLQLEVWDNANNSSRKSIDFNVGAASSPVIYSLSTDCNPATTAVVFELRTDRPLENLNYTLDVYDLSGRKIWSVVKDELTDRGSVLKTTWNLTDKSGVRVPRGIYLYKATVTTSQGTHSTKTEKLAVTAAH